MLSRENKLELLETMYHDGSIAKIAFKQGQKKYSQIKDVTVDKETGEIKETAGYTGANTLWEVFKQGAERIFSLEDIKQELFLFLLEHLEDWEIDKTTGFIIFEEQELSNKFWSTFSRVADETRHRKQVKTKDGITRVEINFTTLEAAADVPADASYYNSEIEMEADCYAKLQRFIKTECKTFAQVDIIESIVSGQLAGMKLNEIAKQKQVKYGIVKYWAKRLREFENDTTVSCEKSKVYGTTTYIPNNTASGKTFTREVVEFWNAN